ncbi:hypothetical protein COCON_G00147770 [Conger conger]|uniref:Molybdate-anion transporter n=1 Tax=Conger conger TaxID=82655 RepID=A0A9Q1DC45_CONCO|nr:hypothetical protein COCON_G00147770 [Conger conger]
MLPFMEEDDELSAANPAFRSFQTLFLRGYLPALCADWLQGPYLYKLYRHYNFLESQIAILYVCGLGSCALFAPVAAWLPQALGRRGACLLFCVAYSACCFTKLSRDYFTLILGRVLGGLSTSLLSTAFEAWYLQRHLGARDFPREWIPATFARAGGWNHGLAVGAGLAANLLAEWAGLGPVAPFLLAVPFLAGCGWVVLWEWGREEAEGEAEQGGPLLGAPSTLPPGPGPSTRARLWRSALDGLRCLLADRRVVLLGVVQALFESVLYIFVFLWTPVLDPHGPPLGLVFSCLMAASMAGSSLYRLATSPRGRLQPLPLLCAAVLLVAVALGVLTVSTAPGRPRPLRSFLAFLLLELGCGLYFPAVAFLQSRVVPEDRRGAVLAWLRLPLLLLACLGLLALHGEVSGSGGGEGGAGTSHMFGGCAVMMGSALLAAGGLLALGRHDDHLRLGEGDM